MISFCGRARGTRTALSLTLLALAIASGCSESGPPESAPAGLDRAGLDPEVRALLDRLEQEAQAAPSSAEARAHLGMAYEASTLFGAAAQSYAEATELEPETARWWYHRAMAHAKQSDFETAIVFLDSTIARDDRYAPAHWRRGNWSLALGDLEAAEVSFRRAMELKADHPAGRLGMARLYLQSGRPQAAADLLLEQLERRPNSPYVPYVYQLLGRAYRDLGRLDDARAALAKGRSNAPAWNDKWQEEIAGYRVSLNSQLKRTRTLLQSGQASEAIGILEELRGSYPTDMEILLQLAAAQQADGERGAAQRTLELALEHHPECARCFLSLASVRSDLGDLGGAYGLVEQAIAINPQLVTAYDLKARLLQANGRFPESLEAWEEALRLTPRDLARLVAAAELAGQLGDREQAAAYLDRAAAVDPNDVRIADARLGLGLTGEEE